MDTLTAGPSMETGMDSFNDRRIEGAGTSAEEWDCCDKLASVPGISWQHLIGSAKRVVIVAPHPDDEILGCGGLMRILGAGNMPLVLVAITDGDASHPGSRIWPQEKLRQERPKETSKALAALQVFPDIHRLSLPDGQVEKHQSRVQAELEKLVRPDDLVLSTWRFDGHPDHEAAGRASAATALAKGAHLAEMPIWAWHWAAPGDARIPWERARKLMLDTGMVEAKRAAIACYRSQLEYDGSTGNEPILPPTALARLLRPYEIYFV